MSASLCLNSFSPVYSHKQAQWCFYDISPAYVVAMVICSQGPGSHVTLSEHTKEPKEDAHFHGWSEVPKTAGEGAQILEEVREDGEALM